MGDSIPRHHALHSIAVAIIQLDHCVLDWNPTSVGFHVLSAVECLRVTDAQPPIQPSRINVLKSYSSV